MLKLKKRHLDEGLKSVLIDRPRYGQLKNYDDKMEAEIIALTCTNPQNGRKR